MKVEEYYAEGDDGYNSSLEIRIDGESVFLIGTPKLKDAHLNEDLKDCFEITNFMKRAYDAGKKGEPYDYKYIVETS